MVWEPDVCIFHSVSTGFACPDGIAAAYVVKLKFGDNVIFKGMTYEEASKFETFLDEIYFNKRILVVDFSLPPAALKHLDNQGCGVRTIDHHISYLSDTVSPKLYSILTAGKSLTDQVKYQSKDKTYFFDNKESGATLTWKLLFPKEPVPPWLELMKQNDLFDFKDPQAEEFHYGMAKLRRSFALLEQIHQEYLQGDWEFTKIRICKLGAPKVEKNLQDFETIMNNPKKFFIHQGIPVCILNTKEMSLKSRIARYLNVKLGSSFCVILDRKLTKFRVKSNKIDLLKLFSDCKAVGHSPTCSFEWQGMTLDAVKELLDRKVSAINELQKAS